MSWPTVWLVDKRPADATAATVDVSASVDVAADAVMRKRTLCCLLPGCPVLFIVALLQSSQHPHSGGWGKNQKQHKTQPPLRIRCQTSVLCLPCFQENSLNFPTDSSEREPLRRCASENVKPELQARCFSSSINASAYGASCVDGIAAVKLSRSSTHTHTLAPASEGEKGKNCIENSQLSAF